jgi:putative nucleotidyltransferase-like protein
MLSAPLLKAVRSLHFQQDRRDELREVPASEWPALLKLTDRSQITLPLGVRRHDDLPDFVRDRIDRNLADNAVRQELIAAEYHLIADALRTQSVEFVVLKGLSQIAPLYVGDSRHRPQYDIDLYCPPESLAFARDAMSRAGFTPIRQNRKRTDHLPAMIRNQDWKWRGDYYAPDLPLTVEIHFRFWDRQTERLPAPWVEQFWNRRSTRVIRGMEVPMLSLADGVSYSALHLMRHLLRGDLRLYHAYELAHFLHHTHHDDALWGEWHINRTGASSVIEAVAFRLAAEWFGCATHPIIDGEMRNLPPRVIQWFELFAHSPLALEQPNKDELFLHLSMVDKRTDRCRILMRRLLPLRAPRLVDPSPADGKKSLFAGVSTAFRQSVFSARRAIHHLRTTLPLIRSLCRWKMSKRKYAVP